MQLADIEDDLLELEIYKNNLDISDEFCNIFYIIELKGRILQFCSKKKQNSSQLRLKIDSYKKIEHYIKEELEYHYFEKYAKLQDLKLHVYIVPKSRLISNGIFEKLKSKVEKSNKSILEYPTFEKIKKHVQEYYKIYVLSYLIIFFIFSIEMYYALNELGFNTDLIKSIDTLLYMMIIIISIISIPFIFASYIFWAFLILVILGIFKLIFKHQKINLKQEFSSAIMILTVVVLASILFASLYYPSLFFSDYFNLWKSKHSKPIYILNIYKDIVGYPKIIEKDTKKYIVVGENNKYFMTYDINKTFQNINKVDYCQNIVSNEENKKYKAIFILLYSSYNNSSTNMQYLLKDGNFTFSGLTTENMDINVTEECLKVQKED